MDSIDYKVHFTSWQIFFDFFRSLVGAETNPQKLKRLYDDIYGSNDNNSLHALSELVNCLSAKCQGNFHTDVHDSGDITVYYNELVLKTFSLSSLLSGERIDNFLPNVKYIGEGYKLSDFFNAISHQIIPTLDVLEGISEYAMNDLNIEALKSLEKKLFDFKFNVLSPFLNDLISLNLSEEVKLDCERCRNNLTVDAVGGTESETSNEGFLTNTVLKGNVIQSNNVEQLLYYASRTKQHVFDIFGTIFTSVISQLVAETEYFKKSTQDCNIQNQQLYVENMGVILKNFNFMRLNDNTFDFSKFEHLCKAQNSPPAAILFVEQVIKKADIIHLKYQSLRQDANCINSGRDDMNSLFPMHLKDSIYHVSALLDKYQEIQQSLQPITLFLKTGTDRTSSPIHRTLTLYEGGNIIYTFSFPPSTSFDMLLREYVFKESVFVIDYATSGSGINSQSYNEQLFNLNNISGSDFLLKAKKYFNIKNIGNLIFD